MEPQCKRFVVDNHGEPGQRIMDMLGLDSPECIDFGQRITKTFQGGSKKLIVSSTTTNEPLRKPFQAEQNAPEFKRPKAPNKQRQPEECRTGMRGNNPVPFLDMRRNLTLPGSVQQRRTVIRHTRDYVGTPKVTCPNAPKKQRPSEQVGRDTPGNSKVVHFEMGRRLKNKKPKRLNISENQGQLYQRRGRDMPDLNPIQ